MILPQLKLNLHIIISSMGQFQHHFFCLNAAFQKTFRDKHDY